MFETNPSTSTFATSELNYLDYRDRTKSFSAFAAWKPAGFSLLGRGDPVQLNGSTVTANYFAVMDSKPIVGALYGPENDRPGGDTHVVVLSEGIWKRVFGSDRSVVGSLLNFDGVSIASQAWSRIPIRICRVTSGFRSRRIRRACATCTICARSGASNPE